MANALYDKARENFLNGGIAWASGVIKAILVDATIYVRDLAVHDNLDDIPAGARISSAVTLGTKTSTDGVADAADVTFPNVSGTTAEYIILFQDSGVEATSKLICCIDTATGLPVTPNGGDIVVQWNNGANKIFKL